MRQPALVLLLSSALALPAVAFAQRAATPPQSPTVDDYVCTFSGDCGQNQNQNADDQNPNGPRPRIQATRGFALSGPEHGAAPVHRAGPPALHRTARNLAISSSSSAAAPPPASGPGQRINLAVTFVSGSAELTPAARTQAETFASALMRPQLMNMRFEINGYTDAVGRRDRNLDLSQRRAQTVADFLVRAGVAADRLVVHGYGPDRPLPHMRATAPQNRRVEVVRVS